MKNQTLKVFVLFFGLLFSFYACNESSVEFSESVQMLPDTVGLVALVDLESLYSKVPEDFLENTAFFEIIQESTYSQWSYLLKNDSLGIGVATEELALFMLSESSYGSAMMLEDAAQFEKGLLSVLSEAEVPVKIQQASNFKSCELDEDVVMLWDESKALMLVGETMSKAQALFLQKASTSIVSNKEFQSFYAERKELSIWMDMDNYLTVIDEVGLIKQSVGLMPMMNGFEDMYEGIYSTYHLEFRNGEIFTTGRMLPTDKAHDVVAQVYREKPSVELLEAIPEQSYIFFTAALNPPEIMDLYQSAPGFEELFTKPEVKDIIAALKGDFAMSITGFATGPFPIPNFVLGGTVKDERVMDALVSIDGVQSIENESYTTLSVNMFQLFVAQRGDVLILTTDEAIVKTFAAGKALDDNILSSKHRLAKASTYYSYVNLDWEAYPAAISGLVQTKLGEEFDDVSNLLCFEEAYSSFQLNSCEFDTHIIMKNKEVNSLTAVLDILAQLSVLMD